MTPMTPYLIGSPWRIGPRPELPKSIVKTNASGEEIHECVDHHLFQGIVT